jgi:hypothetical protein
VTTGKDPMIGRALDVLVPDFDVDPDGVLRAAHAGAASLRATRRRRRTVAAIAFAALLLFAGAAFAAKKYDLLPFLHTNDKNSARFFNTPGPTYHGAAPLALACPGARTGRFICHVTGPLAGGTRLYELGMRTDKEPLLTRQSMLNSLEHAQGVDPSQVAKVKSDLAAVDDDFIRAQPMAQAAAPDRRAQRSGAPPRVPRRCSPHTASACGQGAAPPSLSRSRAGCPADWLVPVCASIASRSTSAPNVARSTCTSIVPRGSTGGGSSGSRRSRKLSPCPI